MRRRKDNVSIQSPPLTEFKNKRSCLKRSCFSGCGCLFIIAIMFFGFLKLTSNPKPRQISSLPSDFPKIISLYDEDAVARMTFMSAKQKGRNFEAVAFLPKLLLSPILLSLDDYNNLNKSERSITLENMINIAKAPVTDHKNSTTIVWGDLAAEPDFIYEFYEKELSSRGLFVILTEDSSVLKQLTFTGREFDGVLTIRDNPRQSGTTAMVMVVNMNPDQ